MYQNGENHFSFIGRIGECKNAVHTRFPLKRMHTGTMITEHKKIRIVKETITKDGDIVSGCPGIYINWRENNAGK